MLGRGCLAITIRMGFRCVRLLRRAGTFLLAVLLPILLATNGMATPWKARAPGLGVPHLRTHAIAIESQPFYPELLQVAQRWQDAPIGQVVGESPRETLLNFYVVMAKVYDILEELVAEPEKQPGLFWSAQTMERAREANDYLQEAILALDVQGLPQSIRADMAMEYALKLKKLLDYSFINAPERFQIPDREEMKRLTDSHQSSHGYWRIPGTSISLVNRPGESLDPHNYYFSAETVAEIPVLYDKISDFTPSSRGFFTPNFYRNYAKTPGYILPPKWYLMLPAWLRTDLLERTVLGQSIIQLVLALMLLVVFLALTTLVLGLFFRTYRQAPWRQDEQDLTLMGRRLNRAWLRVLLIGLVAPMAWLTELLIDNYVNFTGSLLIASKFLFFSVAFLGLGLLAILTFEAVGQSISRWIVQILGQTSDLQLRRVSNLIMPLCRVFGALLMVVTLYHLLAALGLPPQTVLAFSAVPGLAIGLGASKLLGNLFAGLAIQTDRPLKVGEFCQIGEHEGFIAKIGLRSLELNTVESRITIPNAIVDEQKVINYSVRGRDPAEPSLQGLDLRLVIDQPLGPFQIRELFRLVNHAMAINPDMNIPLASLDPSVDEGMILTCHAQVEASDWPRYLEVRQRFMIRLRQILSQVSQCYFKFGVSFETPTETLRSIPTTVAQIFAAEPLVRLSGCRFLQINDFSFDYYVEYESDQPSLALFEEAHGRLLCTLIETFRDQGIDIPVPTSLEIEKASMSGSSTPCP